MRRQPWRLGSAYRLLSSALQIAFNVSAMELEIRPEPDDDERAAIAASLGEGPDLPGAYRSAWRREAADEALEPLET